jgi:hypothetical protein
VKPDLPKLVAEGDYPTCAVCKRPVDSFEYYDEPSSLLPVRILTARCHGKVEQVRLTDQDMRAMLQAGQTRLYLGEAFVPKGSGAALQLRSDVEAERFEQERRRLMGNPGFR